jgi:hypothetical protein
MSEETLMEASDSLDISPSSKHLKQRIWQESITTLLLAAPQCKMPSSQKLIFVDGNEDTSEESTPPYLLHFSGSPAERHIENLKVRGVALSGASPIDVHQRYFEK